MHSDTWYTLYITLRMHGSVIYAYTQNDGVRISKILLDVPRRSITYPYIGTVHSPPYFITRGPVSSRRDVMDGSFRKEEIEFPRALLHDYSDIQRLIPIVTTSRVFVSYKIIVWIFFRVLFIMKIARKT